MLQLPSPIQTVALIPFALGLGFLGLAHDTALRGDLAPMGSALILIFVSCSFLLLLLPTKRHAATATAYFGLLAGIALYLTAFFV